MEDRGSPTANHMDHPHVSFFDDGGRLAPGLVMNGTGRSELVLNQGAGVRDRGGPAGAAAHPRPG
jgi:hypothetical protein